MSTHLPGFQSILGFLHHFVLAKIATSSIRVNPFNPNVTRPNSFANTSMINLSNAEATFVQARKDF